MSPCFPGGVGKLKLPITLHNTSFLSSAVAADLQTQTPRRTRASNLSPTEAARVTFSAITSRSLSREALLAVWSTERDDRATCTREGSSNNRHLRQKKFHQKAKGSVYSSVADTLPQPAAASRTELVLPDTFSLAPRGDKS